MSASFFVRNIFSQILQLLYLLIQTLFASYKNEGVMQHVMCLGRINNNQCKEKVI